ncbi:hypothetical protein, partial [Pedosphaera parvula]
IDAANNVVLPDPAVTTPVSTPAHIRIIFHVDSLGQVRLLKSVAVLSRSTNNPSDLALVTDETLYPNFVSPGKRISAAAFDFGDNQVIQILNQVAASAATAAANGANATNAANQVLLGADVDARYAAFVSGTILNNAVGGAAVSAKNGAVSRKNAGGTALQVIADAYSAATNDARVVTARTNALALQASSFVPDNRYAAAVDAIASAAANAAAASANSNLTAAVVGSNATNAALAALTNAQTAPSIVSPGYKSFIATSTFQSSAQIAGAAAASAVAQAGSGTASQLQAKANSAALKALTDAKVFAAADGVVVNEVLMGGTLAASGALSGSIYLGASHPTNPFRHRMHPDHTIGYPITRNLSIQFDSASGTNAFQTASFGVDKLTGTYREEITGLHKPLGTAQNIGLITEGTITLNRLSLVDTLNQ